MTRAACQRWGTRLHSAQTVLMLPLTPAEVTQFRHLVKPAIVLLVMLRLDRPVGAKEIAAILDLNEHTVAGYLRALARLNLVARAGYRQGYILLGGRQLILGAERNVKKLHFNPTSTTIKIGRSSGSAAEVVEDPPRNVNKLHFEPGETPRNVKNLHFTSGDLDLSALLQALQDAGIGEPKRSALAALHHLTPAYIKAWESYLKLAKGDRYTPGLLIHVLETGDPAPPTNANGHALACPCPDCQRLKYLACPYCGHNPCDCC